jgi:hypothetical protein
MLRAMSPRRLPAALAFAFLAAGCGGGGSTSTPEPAFGGDPSQVLTVTIRNDQMNEARITLFLDRTRTRLGTVRANQSETFRVPIRNVMPVRLEFDLTLGAHCVTRDASLGPGDNIEVTIPVNLNMMAAVCRRN